MSGERHMRKLLKVTTDGGYLVLRHLECGHVLPFECLFGDAAQVAAEARRFVGTKLYCTKCAQGEGKQ